jgi:hypothetical protein
MKVRGLENLKMHIGHHTNSQQRYIARKEVSAACTLFSKLCHMGAYSVSKKKSFCTRAFNNMNNMSYKIFLA